MSARELPDLSQFNGSMVLWRHKLTGCVYTEGMRAVARHCEAFWLIDAICCAQLHPKIRGNRRLRDIQFWRLSVRDGSAILNCREDDGVPPAYRQKIEWTDFPEGDFDVWFENRTLYLPQER